MHLAVAMVCLDLEPEVQPANRERILRAIRDRIKQNFGSKVAVRSDDSDKIFFSIFDDNYSRIKSRVQSLVDAVESVGESRILEYSEQYFSFHEGEFRETDSLETPVTGDVTRVYEKEETSDRNWRRQSRIPSRKLFT